jgi:hypothetical protein
MEYLSSTTSGPALEIADDTISAAQRMMEAAAAPAAAKKEQMENVVADKSGKEESPWVPTQTWANLGDFCLYYLGSTQDAGGGSRTCGGKEGQRGERGC